MKYGVQIVRLLAATAASATACFFGAAYTHLSEFRFKHEHPGDGLIGGTQFLIALSQFAYVLPVVALVLGLWFIRRDAPVWFETVLACTWFMSLVWVGGCLLLWLAQNVPIFTHMLARVRSLFSIVNCFWRTNHACAVVNLLKQACLTSTVTIVLLRISFALTRPTLLSQCMC